MLKKMGGFSLWILLVFFFHKVSTSDFVINTKCFEEFYCAFLVKANTCTSETIMLVNFPVYQFCLIQPEENKINNAKKGCLTLNVSCIVKPINTDAMPQKKQQTDKNYLLCLL